MNDFDPVSHSIVRVCGPTDYACGRRNITSTDRKISTRDFHTVNDSNSDCHSIVPVSADTDYLCSFPRLKSMIKLRRESSYSL